MSNDLTRVATTVDDLFQLTVDLIKVVVYENNLKLSPELTQEIYVNYPTNYNLLAPVEYINYFAGYFNRDPLNITAWLLNCHNLNEIYCIICGYLYPSHQKIKA